MHGDSNKRISKGLWVAMGIVMSMTFSAGAVPVNDDCSQAIALTLNVPQEGTTVDATGTDLSSCSWYDIYDVWYSFTAPRTGPYEVVISNSNFSPTVSVYDACGGEELACIVQISYHPGTLIGLEAGQTYLIRLAGDNWQVGDFTISIHYLGPALDLRSPLGGSQWLVGFPVRIAWDTQALVETVRLEYSANGGSQWTDIATVPNVGHYEWPGPASAGNQYLIRISDAGDPTVSDTTDSVFSVIAGNCDQILNYARSRIFEQTVSGLRAAYPALGLVLSRPDCAGSARLREARFLHAVTRIAMLAVADDSVEPQSFLEIVRLFGLELVGDVLDKVEFSYPTNNHDYYEMPAGAPNWDGIKQILETSSVAEIDAIVAELNLITETSANRFRLWFTPEETGRSNPLEVDIADVKILKSALKWAKGLILAESAYDLNMTEEDQDLLAQKIYGDAQSINQDILNKYPNLLKVLPTPGHPENGKTMLADARKSIVEAIGDILASMTDMESENVPTGSDPQEDELLYIDSSNLREVNIVRQRMTALKTSLSSDTSTVYTFDDERKYQLTDPSKAGRIWYLNLNGYDPFDRPMDGEFWTNDPDFSGSWTITGSEFEGTSFLLELNYNWGIGGGTLTGTINANKTQLTHVEFEYWGWMGQGTLNNLSGQQTEFTTNEIEFNLNPIFGSTARYPNPVSPRNMLPLFTDWNWVLPNTMGAGLGNNATLGGVLPDMTQADWNDAFNARPASEYPTGTIEGTIQFDQWVDEPIYIVAYTDPSDSEGTSISQTMISQPGSYILKGISIGQTVYVRAYVPLFGFKIFELQAFEIERRTKREITSSRTTGVNLALQRPTRLDNGVWYVGALNSELNFRQHYFFQAKKGRKYSFQLDTTNLQGAMILVYSRNAKTELVQRFAWESQEIVDWICPVDGVFYVEVYVPERDPWALYDGTYRIRMVTPTPDINQDGCVGIEDVALVANHWLDLNCELGNDFCEGTDLDHNGQIDLIDFSVISAYWMQCFHPGNKGLVSQWTMDDNAANKTVTDSSDNHFNGTAQQNTSALTAPGMIGTALSFNENETTTDWVDCGTNAALLPDAWTVCAWVQCTDTATPILLSFGGNYSCIKLQNKSNGKPMIHLGQTNYRYFAATAWTTLKDGQWHHVAFTVPGKEQSDIGQATMYLDGVAVAADAAVMTGPQTDKSHVYLGANPSLTAQRFGGAMDQVRLFNRALSAQEISTLYLSVMPNGLAAHWPMDDDAANKTVTDAGDNHLNGTAQQNTEALTATGKLGTSLSFNGATDWVDCGTNAALLPDAWTVCAWVKCTDTATPILLSFGGNYSCIKLQNKSNGKPMIHLGQTNYRYFAATAWTTLKDGQWHHVAFSAPGKGQTDLQQAKMYLDGVAVAGDTAVTTGPQMDKSHVYLGANPSVTTQRFGGTMDDVMLFNRVLTENEINRVKDRLP